ncbi:aspartate kinase [Micromonospora sp.]|uniref:amino acid kinase family protein n=1 Tax=Micromonospora sp. TaxID=1876 RepID=UPI003B3BBD5E
MSRVRVVKFGGSSFAGPEHFHTVAAHLAGRVRDGEKLVVVTSGMPGATEELRRLATELHPEVSSPALLGLLPLADTVGAALLRIALERAGLRAELLPPHHIGLASSPAGGQAAALTGVDPVYLHGHLAAADALVLPGGQAADAHQRPTWLGKNSSDLSAVAVAAALRLPGCDIHSDVEGVYDADPRQVPAARLLPTLAYADVVTMARAGAKVLHPGAVELAARHGVTVTCRLNTGDFRVGSVIGPTGDPAYAVVADARSVVLTGDDPDAVEAVLAAEGLATLRVAGAVVATGSFADVPALLAARGRTCTVTGQKLLTVLRAGVPEYELVPATELAVVARSRHAALTTVAAVA